MITECIIITLHGYDYYDDYFTIKQLLAIYSFLEAKVIVSDETESNGGW